MFFKLKARYGSLFDKIIDEFNLDVYGFSNDQAFPSSNRAIPSFHLVDHATGNALLDSDNSPTTNELGFFAYGGGNNDYDNFYYAGGMNHGSNNHLEMAAYQARMLPSNNSTFANLNSYPHHLDQGKNFNKA